MMIKKISTPIYNINEEGLFASRDYADGRLIPSIVISSKEDDYIKEIIKLHSNISMGDVEVQWGGTLSSLFNADRWILNIRFYKPIDYNFSIVFSLKNHYSIIDAIFQSKGLRIAYGHKGEKVSQVSDHIIIEIPDTGISPKWEKTPIEMYKYAYISPTKELTSSTGGTYGGQYGIYGSSTTKSVNPSDVIAGILIKQGYIILPELKSELANETLIINYGESGRRNRGLGYTIEVTIQFSSAKTNEMICSCTAEGQGETEADDIRQAIRRALSSLFPEK